jgi:hypothetical protein
MTATNQAKQSLAVWDEPGRQLPLMDVSGATYAPPGTWSVVAFDSGCYMAQRQQHAALLLSQTDRQAAACGTGNVLRQVSQSVVVSGRHK